MRFSVHSKFPIPHWINLKKANFSRSLQLKDNINDKELGILGVKLGISQNQLSKIKKKLMYHNLSIVDVEKNFDYLQSQGFHVSYIIRFLNLLCLPTLALQNKLQICDECGCSKMFVGIAIEKFHRFISFPIPVLKKEKLIPHNVNVLDRLKVHMGLSEMNCSWIDIDTNLSNIYGQIFQLYLRETFPANDNYETPKLNLTASMFPSIRTFKNNISLLTEHLRIDFPEREKFYILLQSESLAEKWHLFQEENSVELASECPLLLDLPLDYCFKLLKISKELDIDLRFVFKNITNINKNGLADTLINCLQSPQLNIFVHHPHFISLLRKYSKVQKRLNTLTECKLKCYNLALLLGSDKKFETHLDRDIDRSDSMYDVIVIATELLHIPKETIKKQLTKQKYIVYVPLTQSLNNLKYLIKIGYSVEEISKCIQIIVYPKNIIEEKLDYIISNPDSVSRIKKFTIEKYHHLPLALYLIEKDNVSVFSYEENSEI